MKRLSVLLVAALAAVAVTAAIGSASASATVLCSKAVQPCPSGSVLPKETSIVYYQRSTPGAFTMEGSELSGELNCGEAIVASQSTLESAPILPAKGAALLGECQLKGKTCTTTWSETSNYLEGNFVGVGITYLGYGSPVKIGYNCGEGRECTYSPGKTINMQMGINANQEYYATFSSSMNFVSGNPVLCATTVKAKFLGYLGTPTYLTAH